ncbi:MAG: gliding motility-associated C-terminal domain-containing protein, partial [Bacteroidales bacterium]
IKANINYDSCQNAIEVSWNHYTGWGENLSGYRIYSRTINSGYGNPAGVTKQDSIVTFNNIAQNTRYYFYVEAVKNDTLISRSAIAGKYTYMPGPPENFELIDVDAISPGAVQINFEFNDTSSINDFRLLRSYSETADFISIATSYDLDDGANFFIDSIVTGSERYYYKIGALNSCNKVISQTNIGRNIVLEGYNEDKENFLEWNFYEEWAEDVEEYELRIFNEDGSYSVINYSPPATNTFTHDLSDLFGTGFEGLIRYQVAAKRNGEDIYSLSNVLEIEVKTGVTVPNAFTPNNDGRNDTFKPVFTLLPQKYLMIIYDRYGIIVFKSENPAIGWDGRVNGGELAIEGVYVYHIQYTSHTGTQGEQTGQLTLFYP